MKKLKRVKKEVRTTITPEEWQKRALELDRQGLEISVVGRYSKNRKV